MYRKASMQGQNRILPHLSGLRKDIPQTAPIQTQPLSEWVTFLYPTTEGTCWWVYFVRCSDDSLYCGIAKDPEQRAHHHNHTAAGAKYTRSRRPVSLVYAEGMFDHAGAMAREREIKKMTRPEKEALISTAKAALILSDTNTAEPKPCSY